MRAPTLRGATFATLAPALLALAGCSTFQGPVRTDRPMEDAIREASGRLEASEIPVDQASVTGRGLKTAWRCLVWRGERQGGVDWDASWSHHADGPLPFETVGPADQPPAAGDHCELMFRVELEAHAEGGRTRLDATPIWYKAVPGECAAEGDPLEGLARCDWSYRAVNRTEAAARRVYYALRDL